MSEILDTTEQLFDLYVAECARTSAVPDISDFMVWLEDNGYDDDLSELWPR